MSTIKERRLPNGLDVSFASSANLDILQREVFDENLYDKNGMELKNGDCIFDVGANIGFFLMLLNQHLDDASVYSFEPVPETFDLLKRNAARNNHLGLQLFNCGLSDTTGTTTIWHYPKSNVNSTMYPPNSAEYRKSARKFVLDEMRERGALWKFMVNLFPAVMWWPVTELVRRYYHKTVPLQCKLRTISEVIDEHGVQRIDYLKIDTEGAELDVLRGMRTEHWPIVRQAVIEVHDGERGRDQVLEIMETNGFDTLVEKPSQSLDHLYMVYARK